MPHIQSLPYEREDESRVRSLLTECLKGEAMSTHPAQADLRMFLRFLSSDETGRACMWERNEEILGFGGIGAPPFNTLMFFVHPSATGDGIDDAILRWAVRYSEQAACETGEPFTLRVRPHESDDERIALLERHEFTKEDWHTERYVRSLHDPFPEARLPEGFILRPVDGEEEVDAYVALHREAFRTRNMTVEHRLDLMRDPDYLAELDLVAVAPDGTLAAFCVGGIDRDEEVMRGSTDPLGTRPAFRRRGLARALILENFRRLRDRGVETAAVSTGNWNSETQNLLQSVGYRQSYTVLSYCKELVPLETHEGGGAGG